jgi:HAD superfamily hydrolase (TIGR01509 family)
LSSLHHARHWVFDMDGTLTLAVHDFQAIRAALGVPLDQPILEHIATLPPEAARAMSQRLEEIERDLCHQTEAADGADELLAYLQAQGVRLGILTRNAHTFALLTLEHVGLLRYFDVVAIIGREQARPKPHAEGFERLAALWGVSPAACVMVGDYRYDLEVGRAVGARTVHVHPQGAFEWPALTDVAVRSLRELLPAG